MSHRLIALATFFPTSFPCAKELVLLNINLCMKGGVLHKLITASLFGLFLAVTAGAHPVQAETATFCFTNQSSYTLWVRMYSSNRNWVWGDYVLSDRVRRCATLSCFANEQICFGATNNAGGQWGVGYDNSATCPDCCL
jgi:hypothetical protein